MPDGKKLKKKEKTAEVMAVEVGAYFFQRRMQLVFNGLWRYTQQAGNFSNAQLLLAAEYINFLHTWRHGCYCRCHTSFYFAGADGAENGIFRLYRLKRLRHEVIKPHSLLFEIVENAVTQGHKQVATQVGFL